MVYGELNNAPLMKVHVYIESGHIYSTKSRVKQRLLIIAVNISISAVSPARVNRIIALASDSRNIR